MCILLTESLNPKPVLHSSMLILKKGKGLFKFNNKKDNGHGYKTFSPLTNIIVKSFKAYIVIHQSELKCKLLRFSYRPSLR